MLLEATLIFFTQIGREITVYCPEIALGGFGKTLLDTELYFFTTYSQILDSMVRNELLIGHLIQNNWIVSEEGLFCPDYSNVEVGKIFEKWPNPETIQVIASICRTICIPVYDYNKGLSGGLIPKRKGIC